MWNFPNKHNYDWILWPCLHTWNWYQRSKGTTYTLFGLPDFAPAAGLGVVSTHHYLTHMRMGSETPPGNSPARLQVSAWCPAWRLWNRLRGERNGMKRILSHSRPTGQVTCLTRQVDGFVCLDEGLQWVVFDHDFSWFRQGKLLSAYSDDEIADLGFWHLRSLWQKHGNIRTDDDQRTNNASWTLRTWKFTHWWNCESETLSKMTILSSL